MPRSPAKKPSAPRPRYSPHPVLKLEEAARERLGSETGRTFAQWVEAARAMRSLGQGEIAARLRKEHGLSRMAAHWVAQTANGVVETDYGDPLPLVDALYSGKHAALRAIHEAAVDAALALGDDVVVTACKTMVPLYRRHAFGQLRPVAGGVEAALALGDRKPAGRLRLRRGAAAGDRCAHCVVLRSPADVDAGFKALLAEAYANGAGKISRGPVKDDPPADLERALTGAAARTWEGMTPAMRRDMIVWIEQAKQADTRTRRVATCAAKLAEGKRRVY